MSYLTHGVLFYLFAAVFLSGKAFAMDDAAILEQGRKLFQTDAEPACAICHTLADAGTNGKIGPVLNALNNGKGGMPPFVDHLTVDQMKILAKYVSTVTGAEPAKAAP